MKTIFASVNKTWNALELEKGEREEVCLEAAAKIDDAVTSSSACFAQVLPRVFPCIIQIGKRLVASNWT